MKRLWWIFRYFVLAIKDLRDVRFAYYLAVAAYSDYTDWNMDTPRQALDEEYSCWSE